MGTERKHLFHETHKRRGKRKRGGQDGDEFVQSSGVSNRQNTSTQQVLQLQQTIGNHATQQIVNRVPSNVVQRMPTSNMVIRQLGKPRKNILGVKQSTKYKKALATLKELNDHILTTPLGKTKNEMNDQLKTLMRLYESIINACVAYEGEQGDKAEYFLKLKVKAQNEKGAWISRMMQLATNPDRFGGRQPVLNNVAPASDLPTITDEQVTGQVGAGTNQLDVVGEEGEGGYFKENIDVVPNLGLMLGATESDRDFVNQSLQGTGLEDKNMNQLSNLELTSAQAGIIFDTQNNVDMLRFDKIVEGFQQYGAFQKGGINLSQRDVAMSRLSELLGAGVIARAQKAFRQTGTDMKEGSLMDKARGHTTDDTQYSEGGGDGSVDINDPNLQRLLSRLQLIDALAFQVDRNLSNFYIQKDENGRVVAVTGIDNDMSFGQYAEEIGPRQEFPGLSRFVDAELAVTIMDLDPAMLDLALGDLLSPSELNALKLRLDQLQAHLAHLASKGELLEPWQWDVSTAKGMLDENSSYYANVVNNYNRYKNR